jgi:hypothetical protein
MATLHSVVARRIAKSFCLFSHPQVTRQRHRRRNHANRAAHPAFQDARAELGGLSSPDRLLTACGGALGLTIRLRFMDRVAAPGSPLPCLGLSAQPSVSAGAHVSGRTRFAVLSAEGAGDGRCDQPSQVTAWITPEREVALRCCVDADEDLDGIERTLHETELPILLWDGVDDPHHDSSRELAAQLPNCDFWRQQATMPLRSATQEARP